MTHQVAPPPFTAVACAVVPAASKSAASTPVTASLKTTCQTSASSPVRAVTGMRRVMEDTVGAGGAGGVSLRTKLRVAIGRRENLPVPLMLVMTPRGDVAGLPSENPSPSSVPASYGNRSTDCRERHRPPASSSDSPETPTNQSGLGPIIETRVSRGWAVVTSTSNVALPLPPGPGDFRTTDATSDPLARISDRSRLVAPSSATSSIPGLAVPPGLQNVTAPLCTAPIKVVKCAPGATPPGVASRVHSP